MTTWMKRFAVALAVALIAAQFVPLARINPMERNFPQAPAEVQALIRRSCNDCHSNETQWPWYSGIAPASFLIVRDVKEGRKKLNLSDWESYDDPLKGRKKREIAKEIERGDMPPWYYIPLHPAAKLSPQERELIVMWAKQS